MSERARRKAARQILLLRAKLEPKVRRLILQALRQTSEQARALIKSQQFDAVKYAEYDSGPLMKAYEKAYVKVGLPFAKATEASIIKASTFDGDWWTAFFEGYVRGQMGHKIDGVLDFYGTTIWDKVSNALIRGQAQGDSYYDIARDLMAEMDILDDRLAMRLARTETVAASNFSQLEVVKAQGMTGNMVKTWNTIIDNRTHETHVDANGQSVAINDKFVVGGYSCDFPASEELPTQERDWCRCVVLYEFTDSEDEFDRSLGIGGDE